MVGLALKITEINGTNSFPQVRETLGQLASEASMVEAWVYGMEAKASVENGYFVPDRNMLYGSQVVTQQLYSKVLNTLRELAGGGMIMLPSSIRDFENPDLLRIIEKTQKSPVCSAEERVKFFKLAWDASAPSSRRVTTSTNCSMRARRSSPRATRSARTTGRARRASSTI